MIKLEDIDWYQMWKDIQNREINHSQNEHALESRWDKTAPQFRRWMELDDYPMKLMQHVKLSPEWSLLDIGCGTGAVSIPTAKKAARVTALDISGEMLKILKRDAVSQHLSNISCMHRSWNDVVVGKDIEPHDVVVASISMGREPDIQSALEKIDSAALKYVYITVWVVENMVIAKAFQQPLEGLSGTLQIMCISTTSCPRWAYMPIFNILSVTAA